jgi:hypothetical protein
LEQKAAEEYDNERWGLSPDAVEAAEAIDPDTFPESE